MTTVTEQVSPIDPQQIRDVMSNVPTSVTVVAGQPELTGERAAMIVGSFVFISVEPASSASSSAETPRAGHS